MRGGRAASQTLDLSRRQAVVCPLPLYRNFSARTPWRLLMKKAKRLQRFEDQA